jgi:hypothetical protein
VSKNQNKPNVAREAISKPASKPKYFLNDFRVHSQELFGVKPEVIDGAFLHVKESQITKEEAEKLVKDFLKKEVK